VAGLALAATSFALDRSPSRLEDCTPLGWQRG
jgi:hypothetical protein